MLFLINVSWTSWTRIITGTMTLCAYLCMIRAWLGQQSLQQNSYKIYRRTFVRVVTSWLARINKERPFSDPISFIHSIPFLSSEFRKFPWPSSNKYTSQVYLHLSRSRYSSVTFTPSSLLTHSTAVVTCIRFACPVFFLYSQRVKFNIARVLNCVYVETRAKREQNMCIIS